MKSKKLRIFLVNQKQMVFNTDLFKELFLLQVKRKNISVFEYEMELADALYVDRSSIHNWRMRLNGPGDIEKIQLLAKKWNVDYQKLLVEVKDMENNTMIENEKLNQLGIESISKIYNVLLDYLDVFKNSYVDLRERPQLYDIAEGLYSVFEREYFNIPEALYEQLEEYMDDVLCKTQSYDYVEEDTDTDVDLEITGYYLDVIQKFKEIVNKYR